MNLHDAAGLLGVHYQTAYRWVRDGSLSATKHHGSGYEITEAEVDRFARARSTPEAPPERMRVRNWNPYVDRLLDALLRGDELAARSLVEHLAAGSVSILEICEHVLAPCLAEIGERWHHGSVTVAVEHRATAICDRILARISTHPTGRPRGTVVVTTPAGDRHAMPSAMAALVLREDRWKVHHLGADVPDADVISLVVDVDADLVVISVTNNDVAANAADLIDKLTAAGRRTLLGKPGDSLASLVELART